MSTLPATSPAINKGSSTIILAIIGWYACNLKLLTRITPLPSCNVSLALALFLLPETWTVFFIVMVQFYWLLKDLLPISWQIVLTSIYFSFVSLFNDIFSKVCNCLFWNSNGTPMWHLILLYAANPLGCLYESMPLIARRTKRS